MAGSVVVAVAAAVVAGLCLRVLTPVVTRLGLLASIVPGLGLGALATIVAGLGGLTPVVARLGQLAAIVSGLGLAALGRRAGVALLTLWAFVPFLPLFLLSFTMKSTFWPVHPALPSSDRGASLLLYRLPMDLGNLGAVGERLAVAGNAGPIGLDHHRIGEDRSECMSRSCLTETVSQSS